MEDDDDDSEEEKSELESYSLELVEEVNGASLSEVLEPVKDVTKVG